MTDWHPMDRALHHDRGALVIHTDGDRVLIWQAGTMPQWVDASELAPVPDGPAARVQEVVEERKAWRRRVCSDG